MRCDDTLPCNTESQLHTIAHDMMMHKYTTAANNNGKYNRFVGKYICRYVMVSVSNSDMDK